MGVAAFQTIEKSHGVMYSNLKYCMVLRNITEEKSMERLLTSDEVAEYLRVDVVTIRRLVTRGELTAYRVGGEYRFKLSDIEKYLQRQRIGSGVEEEFSTGPVDQFTQWVHKTLQRKSATPAELIERSNRFDKFTERARKVLTLAQEEAKRFKHNYIGTEHLLLGLVREGEGVAVKVLNSLGVELETLRGAVEFIIGRGDRVVLGEVGLTPRAKRAIELAVDEARRLNHHYIGTEHLLLGMVREGEGIAAGVLKSLGVNLEKVRIQTIQVLSQMQGDVAPAPASLEPTEPTEPTELPVESKEEITCSHCGTPCPAHYQYCFNCGQALTGK
jgi:excisionase family DNA binding protein